MKPEADSGGESRDFSDGSNSMTSSLSPASIVLKEWNCGQEIAGKMKGLKSNGGGLCLLVKGWKGTSWSFPRGKKSKDEEDHKCAIREVLEETGFDVSSLLNKDDHIEMIFGQQRVRHYIIAGPKSTSRAMKIVGIVEATYEVTWKECKKSESHEAVGLGPCYIEDEKFKQDRETPQEEQKNS
ncbi:mRNA-decapping enzyme subunit 2 [Phtheirospermum japonicum]|uniref:mRNA-decapping enzyme subunit 2 n=1 Tax=Phtheirospermum japonicum TaxID=374723 RepID=A0A830B6M7_9LAMI|nr:mRNA-decapping enzyme subunit 2 [Phtheirospermum japonicum]